jgi:NAD(P)-dependent dehydrogenase (short-subunit alcohol dehydrogenase family)
VAALVEAIVDRHGRLDVVVNNAGGSPYALAADASPLLVAQELFASSPVLLAHDGADPASEPGPRLIYANRAALALWQRPWLQMVGMPSRLTAEPAERATSSATASRTAAIFSSAV